MKRSKQTKRALTSSVLALVLCFVMLLGTTFAWFTDNASTSVNKVQAGTFDVALEMKQGNSWVSAEGTVLNFVKASGHEGEAVLWEPGATYKLPELRVKNNGNLALKYRVVFAPTSTDAANLKLAEVLDVYVDGNPTNMTLKQVFDSQGDLLTGNLNAQNATSDAVTISLKMRESAGNAYQGLTINGVLATVQATQYTYEYDSENNNYDAGATFFTTVTTEEQLIEALNNGGNVALGNNIALSDSFTTMLQAKEDGGVITAENSFKGILDGNGYTISNVKTALIGALEGGTICNLTVEAAIGSEGSPSAEKAAVVNYMCGGRIDNVTVTGTVYTSGKFGSIVGRLLREGVVNNCTNQANITATGDGVTAGGIVGMALYTEADKEMTISDCTNTGAISAGYAAGGIVGMSAANVINCVNSGTVTGKESAGGIVGDQKHYGEIRGNRNSAAITAGDGYGCAGGIIGWLRYTNETAAYQNREIITVAGNTNSGSITGKAAAGGIVGLAYNQAFVTDNANTAASISASSVTTTSAGFAAGIVGGLQKFDSENDCLTIAPTTDTYHFVVTGNTSSTAIKSICGNFTSLWAYDNTASTTGWSNVQTS